MVIKKKIPLPVTWELLQRLGGSQRDERSKATKLQYSFPSVANKDGDNKISGFRHGMVPAMFAACDRHPSLTH